ncbi:MAG: PTS system mannose/fructose/sorbose family transporter subunit IID [Deltaproteobacteria bacterium]|jgi:mannose/fructose/N-acetylgalactosamine-specific phosphotransferase system component IID|nr:PTS system mannose/fructose/sorbose family transporter subunit IID [Deltaproteobacteria bacterium]
MQAERPAPARTRRALLLAAARSLFLESSWNRDGQQNLGRAWVEEPALRSLGAADSSPPSRMLKPFNTNPMACGLAVGASIALEREAAEGRARPPEEREEIVASMASMGGALGDQLFWNTWLPFSSLCGFLAVWRTGSPAAALVLPVMFTALAAPARLLAFFQGFRRGKDAAGDKAVAGLLSFRRRLHTLSLFVAGAATVLVLDGSHAAHPSRQALGASGTEAWLFAAVFALSTAGVSALSRGRPGLKGPLFAVLLAVLYLFFFMLSGHHFP